MGQRFERNKISSQAFYNDSLEVVSIPMRDLESLDPTGFRLPSLIKIESTNGYGKYVLMEGYDNWIFERDSKENILSLVSIPVNVDTDKPIEIPEGITDISANFSIIGECSVILPSSLTNISDGAFRNAEVEVTFSEGSVISKLGPCFQRSKITSIVIPASVTSLDYTFQNCSQLTEVEIQGSDVTLSGTFYNATMLKSIVFTEPNVTIRFDNGTFGGCKFTKFDIPEGTTYVGSSVFNGCKNLVSVKIPASLEHIEDGAFSGCTSLAGFEVDDSEHFSYEGSILLEDGQVKAIPIKATSVTVPGTVTSLNASDFSVLTDLTNITFEEGSVQITIPDDCFKGCRELREVKLSSNIVRIGDDAFNGCSKLSSVIISEGSVLTEIGVNAFRETGLIEISIPSTVKVICDSAFRDCFVLGTVLIDSDSELTSMGSYSFASTIIRSIFIPEGVNEIGDSCFSDCNLLSTIVVSESNETFIVDHGVLYKGSELLFVVSGVSEITIPKGVDSIVYDAFKTASSLVSITVDVENTIYASMNGLLLDDSGSRILYIPSAIGDVVIPSGVKRIDKTLNDNPFRDVLSLNSFTWISDSITLGGGSLQSVKQFDTVELRAESIIIEDAIWFSSDIDSLMIISDRLEFTGVNTSLGSRIGLLLIESKDVITPIIPYNPNYYVFKAESICTDNNRLDFTKFIGEGASIYLKEKYDFEPSIGTIKGIYKYDDKTGALDLSSGFVDETPVFIHSYVSGLFVKDVTVSDDILSMAVTLDGFSGTYWDVDVFVDGILADNHGDGTYTCAYVDSERIVIGLAEHSSDVIHKVTFETFGGTSIGDITVYDGGTLNGKVPSDPKKSGHSFAGWYSDELFTTKYDFASRITGDVKIYANWVDNGDKVLVTFDIDHGMIIASSSGGSITSGQLVPKGSIIDLDYEPANGWEFLYWDINGVSESDADYSLTVVEDTEISVALRYVSQSNKLTDIIDIETPRYGEDVTLQWSHHYDIDTGMGVWSGFPSVPAIMDDAVYVRAGDVLYKYDAKTGDEICRVQSKTITAYYLYLGIGGGIVIDYATGKAYDSDLNYLYDTALPFVAVFYDDGYFYGLNNSKVFKFDAETGTLCKEGSWESGVPVTWFGIYGTTSAPVFENGYMYYVSAKTNSDYRGIGAIRLSDGSASSVEIARESGRLLDDGWLTFYSYDGRDYLFLTSYSKDLFSNGGDYRSASITGIEINKDGTLSDSCRMTCIETDSDALSAFVVYNGRGYASGHVMDADKICQAISSGTKLIPYSTVVSEGYQIYKEDFVASHGSIVISTAYATPENDYLVYIYVLAYNASDQAVYIFEDHQTKTVAGSYYKTSPAGSSYGSQAIRATMDGNLVWYTDSGTVYCYGTPANNPYTFEIVSSEGTVIIDGVGFTAFEALKSALESNGISHTISNAGLISEIDGVTGEWNIKYLDEGIWNEAGLISVSTNNIHHTFRISLVSDPSAGDFDVSVTLDKSSVSLYSSGDSSRSIVLKAEVEHEGEISIIWSSDHPEIAKLDVSDDNLSAKVTALSNGTATVTVIVRSGSDVFESSCIISVSSPPLSMEKYTFFIQITKDFDKAELGSFSVNDLKSGISISAESTDAASALKMACEQAGIEIDLYYGKDLKGWINSMFGLKEYKDPNNPEVWTYWVQYHNGVYNQLTLGYYTDGGSFRLIWKSTDEGGSDVDVPPDKPSSSETTTNPDGSTTTTTTTTEKDDSGNTTEKVESTTTNKDGSTSTTVTETMKDASGNITSVTESTSTTSKGDDGSKVTETMSTTTTSSGVTSESSKVTEKETEDGSEVRTESTSTVKDASGNVTETKETVTEVITTSDSVTEIVSTETVRNGVTERTESAVFEYGDGTITSKVENAIGSDGKAKSTSVTTIDVSDGQLTADQAKIAVDGTEGAIDRLPTTPASVEKVVEVRSADASVSVDPKALETLSGFGSGLRIVGDDGSIHVDGDVCNSLSGKPSAVTFSMNADAKDSLNDKQKQVVGDSRFIDLSAKVGDERIHQLGGTATVTFGYTPSVTDDVSRLCVYYVDENGDRFMVTSSFDRDTGTFTIEVDHFSIFMVGMAEESADGGFPTSAVAIVIVVAILAVVGAVVYHSRRS